MKTSFFETPRCMNMGFHYTRQFSRRNRIKVLGLVDHSTDEWEKWYLKMHSEEEIKKIASIGYDFIEIHFLYGFGLKTEAEEYELTAQITQHAHKYDLKVVGYFQFFSIQEETFFIENPWAKDCLQKQADGRRHEYHYNRPALCFTHDKVREYYLKGIEIGLNYCNLDGIRLDNDYFLGCYCDKCQSLFRQWLKENFSETEALRIFGVRNLDGMRLAPYEYPRDPLWQETVKFRQVQRYNIMKLLSERIIAIKPNAVMGGNPAVCRRKNTPVSTHVYYPDLGKTHHFICAENSLFPAKTGNSIRHQVQIYKHGQANYFKVFPSHHLYDIDGRTRWPKNVEECALSLYEALCFGGHIPCTTWGLRMDERGTNLYERPYFIEALTSVRKFLDTYSWIFKSVVCCARIGIYMNRESLCFDYNESWYSLQGIIQILLTSQLPFRFIDTDEAPFSGLDMIIIPNMRLVSDSQIDKFINFLRDGKNIIITGNACMYDNFFLKRDKKQYEEFIGFENLIHIKKTYEKLTDNEIEYHKENGNYRNLSIPMDAQKIKKVILNHTQKKFEIFGSQFIGTDIFENSKGRKFLHLLNYDNHNPRDFNICINMPAKNIKILAPDDKFGCSYAEIKIKNGKSFININSFHTYLVVSFDGFY